MRKRVLLGAPLVLALILTLADCGSGSDDAKKPGSSAPKSSSQAAHSDPADAGVEAASLVTRTLIKAIQDVFNTNDGNDSQSSTATQANSCLDVLRAKARNHVLLVDSDSAKMQQFIDRANALNSGLSQGKKGFAHSRGSDKVVNELELFYSSENDKTAEKKKSGTLKYTIAIEENPETHRAELTFAIETQVETNERPEFELRQSFLVEAGCQLKLRKESLSEYQTAGTEIEIVQTKHYSGEEEKSTRAKVSRELMDSTIEFNDFVLGRPVRRTSFDIFIDIETGQLHVDLEKSRDPIEGEDLLKAKKTNLTLMKARLSKEGALIFTMSLLASSISDYYHLEMFLGDSAAALLSSEAIPESTWEKELLTVSHGIEFSAKASGFTPRDFARASLGYEIQSSKVLSYENFPAYGELRLVGEAKKEDGAQPLPFTYAYTDGKKAVQAGDAKIKNLDHYLQETEYYDFSSPEVQALVERVSQETEGWNLFASKKESMAKKILEVVDRALSYDKGMVEKQTIRPLSASESVRRKKGVCQHYAVLYAAIARALGIPARTVVGFLVTPDNQASTHAWVEISLDGKTWTPLEPQNPGYLELPRRGYIPISVFTVFDQKKGDNDSAGYLGMVSLVNLQLNIVKH